MTNKTASQLARQRWALNPDDKRVGHNGGRKRIYPQCPRYKAHRFVNDRCPCGYRRNV